MSWRDGARMVLASALALAITFAQAHAAPPPSKPQQSALGVVLAGDFRSAATRKELATAALDYWRYFDSNVPRNSPDTEKWLQAERAASVARLGRAMSSPEFALRELANLSSNCVGHFEKLLTAIGVNKSVELYLWLKAIDCYANISTLYYLRQAGLQNGDNNGAFDMTAFGIMIQTISGDVADGVANN
jgi:hypothetical protein